MGKVSVIIPVFNKEKYIEVCLRSVLRQNFRDLEIIAVNDGSTDGSLEIVKRVAMEDNRIRVIDRPNMGVSAARNTGLGYATGEWIQFLDADDLLDAEYLTRAVAIAEENHADILFSGFTKIDTALHSIGCISVSETGVKNQPELCDCFMRHQYENGFFGFISNKLFRRSLWEISGAQFPVGTTLAEDLDFYARLYPAVKTAYFWNGNSFLYRQSEENYQHREKIDYCSQLLIHMDIRDWFQKVGCYSKYEDKLNRKISQYALFVLLHHRESDITLDEAFHFLVSRADIMACLDFAYLTGYSKLALYFLQKEKLAVLKLLFAGRNTLRCLYRVVRKLG